MLLAFWQKSIPVHHNHARGTGVQLLPCVIVYFLSNICYNILPCLLGKWEYNKFEFLKLYLVPLLVINQVSLTFILAYRGTWLGNSIQIDKNTTRLSAKWCPDQFGQLDLRMAGRHSLMWVLLPLYSSRVSGSTLHLGYCLCGFSGVLCTFLPVNLGFFQDLRFPPTLQKQPLDVKDCVNVFVCVWSPEKDLVSNSACFHISCPTVLIIGSGSQYMKHHDPKQDKAVTENGWINR